MKDEDEIAKYRAGHAERMVAAQARADENLRKHEAAQAREAKRAALVARIEKFGGTVHDGNCCEAEYVELPPLDRSPGYSMNIDLAELSHGDGSDPGLLVLEVIANLLEAYRA